MAESMPAAKLAILLPISSRSSTPEAILRQIQKNIVQISLAQPPSQSEPSPCTVFVGLDHDDALVQDAGGIVQMFRAAAIAAEVVVFTADELSAARVPAHEV